MQTHPVLFLDYARPNFLVPEARGDRNLDTIYRVTLGPKFEAYGGEDSAP